MSRRPRKRRAAPGKAVRTDLAAVKTPDEVLAEWYAQAGAGEAPLPPGAMTLVTVDAAGRPSARIVICQRLEPWPPAVSFLTRAGSRKTQDIGACQNGAALFYWPRAGRQVRLEGSIVGLGAEAIDTLVLGLSLLKQVVARRMRPAEQAEGPENESALTRAARRTGEGCAGYRLSARRIELWESRPLGTHVCRAWERVAGPGGERWESEP